MLRTRRLCATRTWRCRCATALGVPTVGTLRILLEAKGAGLVPAVAPLIEGLRRAGIFLSDSVIANALTIAGESK